MILETDFPRPVPSFQRPVPLITVEPNSAPYVCVRFNEAYVPYVLGALLQLLLMSTWATDNETDREQQLERISDLISLFMYPNNHCTPNTVHIFEELTDMAAIRVDCDCNVFITCCDGTEKQLALQSSVPPGGSPGTGTPQPAPGGGHQDYCQLLAANKQMLIPTPINTGDVITLVSAKGSWWDGGENALGFPVWRCPDGEYFFAGNCQGTSTKRVTGTDPAVAAAHMALIVQIGSNSYDLTSGPFTVPSGVSNATAVIQVNDTDITNNQGDADVCVRVTNNQATTFTHTFDFTVGPQGMIPFNGTLTPGAIYQTGLGWGSNDNAPSGHFTTLEMFTPTVAAFTLTRVEVHFSADLTMGPTGARKVSYNNNTTNFGALDTGAGTFIDVVSGSQPSVTSVGIFIDSDGGTSLNFLCTKVIVSGVGTDPF